MMNGHMAESLIITLIHHPKFGYMLQPAFALFRHETEVYTITEIASISSSTFPLLGDDEQEIVRCAERYTDKNLMVSYSREKSEAAFLQKVTEKDIDLYIRPFIENRHKEIAALLLKTNSPVFIRNKIQIRDFRINQALEQMKEPSRIVFIFRNKEIFTYTVKVQNGKSEIVLDGRFFAPLVSNPALAVIGSQLHHFIDIGVKKLIPFLSKKQITVPVNSVATYIRKFVVQCVENYETIGEGLTIFEQKHDPVAVLTLEKGMDLLPVLHLRFQYGNNLFSMNKPYKKEVELNDNGGDFSIGWYYRDRDWEERHIQMLTDSGLCKTPIGHFVTTAMAANLPDRLDYTDKNGTGPSGVVEWLNLHGDLLKNFELKQSFGKVLYYTGEIDLEMDISDNNDWFDIQCLACFGEVTIPFVEFKNHILNGIREYVLPDGRIAILPREWFFRFDELFRFGKVTGDSIRLGNTHFRVKELAENGRFSEIKTGERLLSVEPPPSLNTTLRPYQESGFRWLVYLQKNGFGGCLADDMGLGKTLQTIALLLHLYVDSSETPGGIAMHGEVKSLGGSGTTRAQGKPDIRRGVPQQLSLFDNFAEDTVGDGEKTADRQSGLNKNLPPTLIVMPTSLVHNWLNELNKFAPQLKVYAHYGSNRLQGDGFRRRMNRCQVILTSYGVVRQDIDLLSHYHFYYLVLDESQNIKNPESKIFECVKQLYSSGKLALTGTPIENSLSDLWSQMDFLNEGILGKRSTFKARFNERDVINDEEACLKLFKIIDPFILRRTKEEVAPELPPLTEETVYCEMEEEQAACYNEEKSKIRNVLLEQWNKADKSYTAAALSSLTRLRLLANHPAISFPGYEGSSAKFDQVISQAETIFAGKYKVLIFSSFVKHLQLFADYFDRCGWRYAWLTGSTTDRQGEIEKFNNDDNVQTFFISLKAGGTGLNLTAADYVFILDPWWNPAAEMQAVSRAHRIGQDRKVTLYRFITKNTVEEKIQRLQHYKSSLSDALIRSQLSIEEMKELLFK